MIIVQIALKNKEQYMEEMEVYKQKKEEEASTLKKDEEELMKLQKQEAMQLLKKKEKTDTLIKVLTLRPFFMIMRFFNSIQQILICEL